VQVDKNSKTRKRELETTMRINDRRKKGNKEYFSLGYSKPR
jgi:hypothetical protein